MRTKVEGAWVVGFEDGDHVLHEDGVVVFEDDEVVHVGSDYDGGVDRTLSGDYLVVPGLVNMHAHVDVAIGGFWYDRQRGTEWTRPKEWVVDPDEPQKFTAGDLAAGARHSMTTMLKTGTTTFADLTTFVAKRWDDPVPEPHVYAETAGDLGLRAYLSHRYRTGVTYRDDDGEQAFVWDEAKGRRGFERALRFADQYEGAYDGRIRTMLFPYTLDSVSEDLLRDTKAAADERGIQVRMHTAQSTFEVEQLRERHGQTPVDYLDDLGYLDDNVCLTHCLYPDGKARANGIPDPDRETLERIGDSGATVVHCPLVYRRRGGVLNSFSRYRDAGINVTLGTDTFPQNVVEEMRWAALANKWVDRDKAAGSARELFEAVTLGGARALGRDDIGRLEPGAKADAVVVDLSGGHVRPLHDPIKALVHYVTPEDVRHVFVDGEQVVEDGSVRGVDEDRVLAEAQRVHDKMGRVLADWLDDGEPREAFPPSYPRKPDLDARL